MSGSALLSKPAGSGLTGEALKVDGKIDSLDVDALPIDTLNLITQWATRQPQALALLHKQRGRWQGFRWNDVPAVLERLRHGLIKQGLGQDSRLALSGALEPQLILLALAAHSLGASIITIDSQAQGPDLKALLAAANPSHAFVQDRKTIAAWLASGYAQARSLPLFTSQLAQQGHAAWQIIHLHDIVRLNGELQQPGHSSKSVLATYSISRLYRRAQSILWVDEGTEWQAGLSAVVTQWLAQGATLAAPEITTSSVRDRHELQPHDLLASAARRQQVDSELEARLPLAGSWQRSVLDRALHASSRLGGKWLAARLAHLHGLPLRYEGNIDEPSPLSGRAS